MAWLIPAGTVVTLLGLGGLIWCIVKVSRARKSGLDEDALKAAIQSTIALNLGALFLSAIGLALVVVGILLS